MKTMNKTLPISILAAAVLLACGQDRSKDASQARQEGGSGVAMSPGKTSMSLRGGKEKVADGIFNRKRAGKLDDDQDIAPEDKKTTGKRGKKRLKFVLLRPFDQASGRYLEYTVNLSYKTKDLEKSRKLLLDITSKYGFIKTSSAYAGGDVPSLNAGMHLKVERLYDALKELDALGELKSENIRAKDHTENMFWRGVQMRREALRLKRKAGFGRIAPTSKNWAERNRSLEQSENSEDKARFERWKMRDRTSWAKVNISLRGPDLPTSVRVPKYRNAFIGLVNLALNITYGLVWLSPLLILAGLLVLLIRKRKAIFARLRGKAGAKPEEKAE